MNTGPGSAYLPGPVRTRPMCPPSPHPKDTTMATTVTTPTCAYCATPATERGGCRWCQPCGHWLERDPLTGEWISPAELIARRVRRDNTRLATAKATAARAELAAVRAAVSGSCSVVLHTTTITISSAETTAALYHDPDRECWHVRIHEPGISAPIYTAGGAHVAYYRSAAEAARAAVAQLPHIR